MNTLYYGDNLDILRRYIADESVDLIYLDPPFNSKATYNVLFAQQDGSRAASQLKAFGDTWKWDQAAASAYEETVEAGGQVSQALQAFRQLLGTSNMLAYLTMMAPRLVELRRVLKLTGSVYLHCDPTASHYLKVLMDSAFGTEHFLNEIAWCHYGGGQSKRWFPRKHDTLLLYRKGKSWTFNADAVRVPYESDYKSTVFGKKGDPDQRVYLPNPKGKVPEDFWIINRPYGEEVLGYPTQKPEALLERIILASSSFGDLVLDPFCGCGTTVAVAQRLDRRWIGIDIAQPAMQTIKKRFADTYPQGIDIRVIGEPVTVPDAQALAKSDPYQFQWWALGLVGARPEDQKKGADRGIDGILPFHDEEQGRTKHVILSVKAGAVDVSHIRDLRGVVERERAELGALIAMQEPTQPMRTEAASAGFYRGPWNTHHPKLQILTIAELLGGKGLDLPPIHRTAAFRRARKANRDAPGSQTTMEL